MGCFGVVGRGKASRCKGRGGELHWELELGLVYTRITKTKHASAFALCSCEIPLNFSGSDVFHNRFISYWVIYV